MVRYAFGVAPVELVEIAAFTLEAVPGAMAGFVMATSGSRTHRAIAIRVLVSASHWPEELYLTPGNLRDGAGEFPDSAATTLSFP